MAGAEFDVEAGVPPSEDVGGAGKTGTVAIAVAIGFEKLGAVLLQLEQNDWHHLPLLG